MCCLCFERVEQSELNKLDDGQLEDVCKICAEAEDREKHCIIIIDEWKKNLIKNAE